MKHSAFSAIIIIIISLFSFTVYAQDSDDKISEQEKQNVIKFADSFLDSFIENQDIERVPTNFFEKNFKTRFVKSSDLKDFIDDGKLTEQEKAKRIATFYNFFNLLILTFANSDCPIKNNDENSDDSDDSESFKKCLPSEISEKLKQTNWLKVFVEDKNDKDPKESKEIDDFFKEMWNFSDFLRVYLRHNPPQKTKKFQKVKERFFTFYSAEKCSDEECMGLPENTPIFAVHELMMCLRIAKINGQWKVVQIYSVVSED